MTCGTWITAKMERKYSEKTSMDGSKRRGCQSRYQQLKKLGNTSVGTSILMWRLTISISMQTMAEDLGEEDKDNDYDYKKE
jgi:hypothetical protein